MTLADLKPGQKAVIRAIDTRDPVVQRLMVLGLVEGVELEFEGTAIGGDPIEVRLYGIGISLRRDQAQSFAVAPVDSS